MSMTIFLYRWKIKSGKEKQFEENWASVTKAIREQCGSYGSRLHLAENGDYIGYAQWPDTKTRERCELDQSSSKARALMREAVEQTYPDECHKNRPSCCAITESKFSFKRFARDFIPLNRPTFIQLKDKWGQI